ncbi:MAG: DUF2202 domain-containing protein [Candidatus Izemoplasma sp.]
MKKIAFVLSAFFLTYGLAACNDEAIVESYTDEIEAENINNIELDLEDNSILGWGSVTALSSVVLTIEEMLTYAIQDEYSAKTEYEYIIANFEVTKPFTNIIEAEKSHIEMLLPLFNSYGLNIPTDYSKEYIIEVGSIVETFVAGVDAEIINIAMYNMFLEYDLPKDIEDVFIALRDASIKHLNAFERNLAKYQ